MRWFRRLAGFSSASTGISMQTNNTLKKHFLSLCNRKGAICNGGKDKAASYWSEHF